MADLDSEDDLPLAQLLAVSRNEALDNEKIRNEHYSRLTDILSANGYALQKVPKDGDCAFSSLITQIQTETMTVDSLRLLTSHHLQEHSSDYMPITALGNDYVNESEQMKKHGFWKSVLCDIIPTVFANMTQRPVLMFTSDPLQQYMEFHPSFQCVPLVAIKTPMVHLARSSIEGQEHFDSFCAQNENHVLQSVVSIVPKPAQSEDAFQIEDDSLDGILAQGLLDDVVCGKDESEMGRSVEKWFLNEMDTVANISSLSASKDIAHDNTCYTKIQKELDSEFHADKEAVKENAKPQVKLTTDMDSDKGLETNKSKDPEIGEDYVFNIDHSYRKRKRAKFSSPETWQKNIRKTLRNEGSKYVGVSGKLVKQRSIGPVCNRCHFQCGTSFSSEDREAIFTTYWGSGNKHDQSSFIASMVEEQEPATKKRNAKLERGVVRWFHLPQGMSKIRVCKRFFLSTLDISPPTVVTALRNSKLGVPQGDKRGKHTPSTKTKTEDVNFVKQHIETFPKMKPHYNRHDSTRDYLESGLNIRSMYTLYQDYCKERNRNTVKEHIYRHIFHTEFNLSFHKPKKDSCLTCDKHKTGSIDEDTHSKHMERKKAAQEEKERDKAKAKEDVTRHTATFDLEQVLSTPSNSTSTIFYKRKLSVYNLSIYSCGTGSGTCILWNESEGMRGANEIGTCMYIYLKSLAPTVDQASLYSDNCGGQNKNKIFAVALMLALNDIGHLKTIDHKFLERGHTHMEVDSVHAAVEHAKKNVPVLVPRDWEIVCRLARKRSRAYNVLTLSHKHFLNLRSMGKKINLLTQIPWQSICWVRYVKVGSDIQVMYKRSYHGYFIEATAKQTRHKANTVNFVHEKLYSSRLNISDHKKSDLLALCRDGTIPCQYHSFYEDLPSVSAMCDRVPVTDDEEGSEDEE